MSLSENSDSFFDWGQAEELLEILGILCWGQLLVVSLPALSIKWISDQSMPSTRLPALLA
ncbi:hypothetical protein [uncultured Lactobacillus sp.]|uniref:hypothetical protein n=1 Tax=uncultured Lactobacillus sp. TaxID=153152 RepID=UPI0025DCBF56|nr:hypothetical protein [uncultured Lactobacillus sp.]